MNPDQLRFEGMLELALPEPDPDKDCDCHEEKSKTQNILNGASGPHEPQGEVPFCWIK